MCLSLANYLVSVVYIGRTQNTYRSSKCKAGERHSDIHGRVETLGLAFTQSGESARDTRRLLPWAMLCNAFSVFAQPTSEQLQLHDSNFHYDPDIGVELEPVSLSRYTG